MDRKVSIITLQCVSNYGTQLQAYSTQEKFRQFFKNVSLINYKRSDTFGVGLLKQYSKGSILRALFFLPTMFLWKLRFNKFKKNYLNVEHPIYVKESDFLSYQCISDVYITGSDQVWNSGWNKGISKMMYLSFVPDSIPKYGYSVSFGREHLPDNEIIETKNWINRYRIISARELSGVDILKNQYDYKKCLFTVDPTLAFSGNWWRNKVKSKKKIQADYILVYNLSKNKEMNEYVKKLSNRLNLKIVRLCTRLDQIVQCGKPIVVPDILDFIYWIDNARYVVTDSFHATAFSMNLETEPICVLPRKYSSRIHDFLVLLGETNRELLNFNDFDIINRKVDFNKVSEILSNQRRNTDEFIKKISEDIEKFYEK